MASVDQTEARNDVAVQVDVEVVARPAARVRVGLDEARRHHLASERLVDSEGDLDRQFAFGYT